MLGGALEHIARCLIFTSIDRATNVASQPIAIESGCSGLSTAPDGVLLVTLPSGDVGEYWPLVRP